MGQAACLSVKASLFASLLTVALCGCTPITEYIHNGFKVGPNYHKPSAPVATEWIDAADQRVRSESGDLSKWWTVFNDPILNTLVCKAYGQNLSLRQAAFQVLQARAQLGIAAGNLFPQTQTATGDYMREAVSTATANRALGAAINKFFDQWDLGFNLSWELDFWGRLRRAVESAEDNLDASVENYDDVLVTLLGDVATNYVSYRTLQEQIKLTQKNVTLQRQTLQIAVALAKGGRNTDLDVAQAKSTLAQTESQIPQLEVQLRQAANQLCILLGMPPQDLQSLLETGPIPTPPVEVVAGIPADLLRRRPDVRKAERLAAAQSAQIGIAEAEFYPRISLNGNFGYSAATFKALFTPEALQGSIGPAFQWQLFNYGRILNNVRAQDAQFQTLVAAYQNTVLTAADEVENGLAAFLKGQAQVKYLEESVNEQEKAYKVAYALYKGGLVPFVTLVVVQQNLVQQENLLAQARGAVALGLIQVYRALGGGWQVRLTGCAHSGPPASEKPQGSDEVLPAPRPVPPEEASGQPRAQLGMPRQP
jgi:NodT family efflux transporter outer membrane factor (OMF) lipoprotein